MKHAAFGVFLALFILYGGQNWHHYAAALMARAWVRYGGDLTAEVW